VTTYGGDAVNLLERRLAMYREVLGVLEELARRRGDLAQ
jgi:hypothetical protein